MIGVPPSDLGGECPVEIRRDGDGAAFPTAEQAAEACPVVGATEQGARVVVAVDAELPLPMVRGTAKKYVNIANTLVQSNIIALR